MEKYYHKCQECGGHAFEYKKKPYKNMLLSANDTIHKDRPEAGDEIICQECQMGIPNCDLNMKNVITINKEINNIKMKTNKKRPVLTIILVIAIVWTFGYMIFEDDGPSQPKASTIVYVGEEGILNNNAIKTDCAGNSLVGVTKENQDELTQSIITNDRNSYFKMLGNGKIFAVANCTKVKKIDSTFSVSKVHILEGKYIGASGWLPNEFIIK